LMEGPPLSNLKAKCPAFSKSCPYKTAVAEPIAHAIQRCPGFQGGCPFKDVQSVETVFSLFETLSPEAHQSLPSILKALHEVTAAIRRDGGHEPCPVFSPSVTGCPFKTLTLAGRPLVHELEAVAWRGMLGEMDAPPSQCPFDSPLSKQLKEGTRDAHRKAENVHFVREFIKGRVRKEVYMMMIKDLYHVYTALEECAEACSADPVFGPMHFPHELTRAPALAEDMAFYFGADWRRQPQCAPSAAATKYVERLRAVAATRPSLLLAHSYTRYLGDLSGGRVLMRVAVKTMQLDAASGDGVRFYVFDNVPDSRAFKKQFRASLDALPIDAELASALVDEANAAFVLNMELFRFLDEQMGLADVPVAPSTADPGQCPFLSSGKMSSGVDGAPGSVGSAGGISNCPVHLAFYTSRPWLLHGLLALLALLPIAIAAALAADFAGGKIPALLK